MSHSFHRWIQTQHRCLWPFAWEDAEIAQGSPGQFCSDHPTTLTPHDLPSIHSLCAVCERAVQVGRACTKPEQTRGLERAFRSLVGKSCSHPRCWMSSHGHWAATSARGLSQGLGVNLISPQWRSVQTEGWTGSKRRRSREKNYCSWQGLRPLNQLPITVIAELNTGHKGASGLLRPLAHFHQ